MHIEPLMYFPHRTPDVLPTILQQRLEALELHLEFHFHRTQIRAELLPFHILRCVRLLQVSGLGTTFYEDNLGFRV